MDLWHYTCEHGRAALGDRGLCKPLAMWNPRAAKRLPGKFWVMGQVAWFTDLDVPFREALGLTGATIECDRSRFRYRVVDEADVVPWIGCGYRTRNMLALEREAGAMPRHWWVSAVPVPVEFAPR